MNVVAAIVSFVLSWIPASWIASVSGHECDRGCFVANDGWVYEVTRDDLVWFARAAHCEIESVIGTDDAEATLWALAQNFYRRHLVGRNETFAGFVSNYSACTSAKWATGGSRYSPRITPIADENRRTRWRELPQRTRDFVRSFLRGEIPNRWPGWVYVWTHGWERYAEDWLVGPYYAETCGPNSLNAYYQDPSTVDWTTRTLRIAPGWRDEP